MDARRLIPSMFHRRLVLLLAVLAVVTSGLSAQLVRLSVVEGAERRAEAESRLDRRVYLPTYRGRIVDRHGRVLAEDRAAYDIAVSYEVATGSWISRRAAARARAQVGTRAWNAMSPEAREEAIRHFAVEFQKVSEDLWHHIERLGGIDRHEITRRRDAIRAEVQRMAAVVWENQRARWEERFGTEAEAAASFRPRPIREQRQPHVILPAVPDDVAFEVQRLASGRFEGMVHVLDSRRRVQPWSSTDVTLGRESLPRPLRSSAPITVRVDGIADHVIGSVRDEVWEVDVKRRPFVDPRTGAVDLGGYRPGDFVGSRGLEAAFEDHLRGLRGVVLERRDTGEQQRNEAVPGRDLRITLDIMLQSRIQAILSHQYGLTRVQRWHNNPGLPEGQPLNAAAVVMEVDSGEILAMVSAPTIAQGRAAPDSRRGPSDFWVNRAAEAIYPPGSILKPLVLSAAVAEGLHSLSAAITCRGHYFDNLPTVARCWIFRERYGMATHGPLQAEEAMARSCNMFFYTLADRLGVGRLTHWLRRFGLGSPLEIGLLHAAPDGSGARGESGGSLPSEDDIAGLRQRGELGFASVILGIGQGPVTWTPVQAANAYATIARGGIIRDATLVPDEARAEPRTAREHLSLSPSVVSAVLDGLRQSVAEPHGTGYRIQYDDESAPAWERTFDIDGITVWAKTGTAQAPPLRIDGPGDGETDEVVSGLSHAWVVGLVGSGSGGRGGEPEYAIAVIVEYGGSGGRVAGPIANQIIRALQHEGYLPEAPRGAGA